MYSDSISPVHSDLRQRPVPLFQSQMHLMYKQRNTEREYHTEMQ